MKRIFTINTLIRIVIIAGLLLIMVTAFSRVWYTN
jgi:hypothetical protein